MKNIMGTSSAAEEEEEAKVKIRPRRRKIENYIINKSSGARGERLRRIINLIFWRPVNRHQSIHSFIFWVSSSAPLLLLLLFLCHRKYIQIRKDYDVVLFGLLSVVLLQYFLSSSAPSSPPEAEGRQRK